jgi:peptidyl-prolyl cis-trans isomerase A (cyclophilin A)
VLEQQPQDAGVEPQLAQPKERITMGMMDEARAGKDLFATFDTTEGMFTVKLFSKDAPKTVENFVGLATGEREWTDPNSGEKSKRPLYDGTIFHRCIADFMIQGGDPTGTGRGGPGYRFEDEFQGPHKFDRPGLLAMANAGPNTNGSQIFITVAPTPHLTKRHTIFGEVVSGQNVVNKVANDIPKGAGDRPVKDVKVNKLTISTTQPA